MISTKCNRVGGSKKDAAGEGHRAGDSSKVFLGLEGRSHNLFHFCTLN